MSGDSEKCTLAGTDAGTAIDYILHVDMVVLSENATKFESKVNAFLSNQGFKSVYKDATDLLVLALKSKEPFAYNADGLFDECTRRYMKSHSNKPTKDAYHYVHIWAVNTPQQFDLGGRMLACADNSAYMEIDALVECEIQDFMRRVHWSMPAYSTAQLNAKTHFVRTVRRFSTRDLAIYLFKMRGIFKALESKDWKLAWQFQPMTGALNSVANYWEFLGQPKPDLPAQLKHDELESLDRLLKHSPHPRTQQTSSDNSSEAEAILRGLSKAEGHDTFVCPGYFLDHRDRSRSTT